MIVEGIHTNIPLHREQMINTPSCRRRHLHPLPREGAAGRDGDSAKGMAVTRQWRELVLESSRDEAEAWADAFLEAGGEQAEDADAEMRPTSSHSSAAADTGATGRPPSCDLALYEAVHRAVFRLGNARGAWCG